MPFCQRHDFYMAIFVSNNTETGHFRSCARSGVNRNHWQRRFRGTINTFIITDIATISCDQRNSFRAVVRRSASQRNYTIAAIFRQQLQPCRDVFSGWVRLRTIINHTENIMLLQRFLHIAGHPNFRKMRSVTTKVRRKPYPDIIFMASFREPQPRTFTDGIKKLKWSLFYSCKTKDFHYSTAIQILKQTEYRRVRTEYEQSAVQYGEHKIVWGNQTTIVRYLLPYSINHHWCPRVFHALL